MNITTLICNFNNANWITKSIKSAKNQTIDNNICVIDDGSTDNSKEVILTALFDKYTKIEENEQVKFTDGKHIFIQLLKNFGPSYARNVGIRETINKTKFYAILDADDEFYPNKLERCLIEMNDESVGVVYADYDILNVNTGNVIREFKERFSLMKLNRECIVHSGSLIRATYLNKVFEPTGWYDINFKVCEDFELWHRLSEVCRFAHIPEALTLVRVHNNNSTNSVKNEIWQDSWKRLSEKKYARNNKKNQSRT